MGGPKAPEDPQKKERSGFRKRAITSFLGRRPNTDGDDAVDRPPRTGAKPSLSFELGKIPEVKTTPTKEVDLLEEDQMKR